MLESRFLVPPAKQERLKRSWAHGFNLMVLPLINEELFRACFHDSNGRPNKSIRMLTGVHLLKEWNDLTDEQVLENLEFNLQWHYALGLTSEEAHTCQKTLHNYRVMLLEYERAQAMFDAVTTGIAAMDGLGFGRQRLDSTHIMSNIAALTRLALFVKTMTKFLHELRREAADKLGAINAGYAKRYLEREGYFADAKRKQARRRLPVVARDLLALVRAFESDEEIREWESYGLMVRLLEEQCEVIEPADEEQPVEAAPPVCAERTPGDAGEGRRCDSTEQDDEEGAADECGEADEADDEGGDDERSVAAERDDEDDDGDDERSGMPEVAPEDCGAATEGDDENGDDESGGEPSASEGPLVRLKEGKEISGDSLQSPHDPDATYGHKGKGYEVQLAETCEESNPYQIITGVDVNGANESDQHATVPMVEQLAEKGLKPKKLFTDTAYGSGENIVECAGYGVDLQAPVQDPNKPPPVDRWAEPVEAPRDSGDEESRDNPEEMFGLGSFNFNSEFFEVESCPAGHAPVAQEVRDAPTPFRAVFSQAQCAGCPLAERCPTRLLKSGDRLLRWRDVKAATATRQLEQRESRFKEDYKIRSGVESTAGEFKGRHGGKKLRVREGPRVRVAAFLKAAALNAKRMVQYHTRLLNTATDPALAPAGAVE